MLKYLIEKEFRQIVRNPFLPRMILVFPLLVILVLPFAANYEIRNINLAVVDNDRSSLSSRLVGKVLSSGYFRLSGMEEDYSAARTAVELDTADVILEIPAHFERELLSENRSSLMVSANTVNGTKGGLGSAYLSSVIGDFSTGLCRERSPVSDRFAARSLSVIPRYRFNPRLEYPIFMIPALMVMVLAMVAGFLPALNIVGEKEKGTIEAMNVTPVKRSTFILSKLIPFWIIGFVVLTICFIIAAIVYRLLPAGSLLSIYLVSFMFVFTISGFGLVISNYASSVQQAMFMMFFFVMTFVFLSGLYTPVESMPAWAQTLSYGSPLRYMIEVLRSVYLKGSGIADLLPQVFSLLGLACIFNIWAILSYRKRT